MKLTTNAWKSFNDNHEATKKQQQNEGMPINNNHNNLLEIQTLNVLDFIDAANQNPIEYLQTAYGKDWRERPLLLKGLWNITAITTKNKQQQTQRQTKEYSSLSINGLLQMNNLTIPYFIDSRIQGKLEPDGKDYVSDIVERMLHGHPHKIGTQFIIQTYPQLLFNENQKDVLLLITDIFGDFFSIDKLLGHGKTFGILPGITTVPVFIANGNATSINVTLQKEDDIKEEGNNTVCDQSSSMTCPRTLDTDTDDTTTTTKQPDQEEEEEEESPVTGLHCEPIANVAIQILGFRHWTLVDPQYSLLLKPTISKDGRSFYPSWIDQKSLQRIPRYEIITYPGDALFVPTWTWHRVNYMKESSDLSIGMSLFHFRFVDYIRRNPLFAILMIPALIGELAGISSQ
jgi:hypothetical protein